MKKISKKFVIVLFVFAQITVIGQDTVKIDNSKITPTQPSVTTQIEGVKEGVGSSDAKNLGILIGAVLAAIAALGAYYKAHKDIKDVKSDYDKKIEELKSSLDEKIRKDVDANIASKSEEFVSKYFSEKVGVNPVVVRDFFQKLEKANLSVKSKRLLVVNQNDGKRLDLLNEIEKVGFSVPIFKKLAELKSGINYNEFDVLLIDNEFGNMDEKEIEKLVTKNHTALRIVCFTGKPLTAYNELKDKAKIIQMRDRLAQALIDASKL